VESLEQLNLDAVSAGSPDRPQESDRAFWLAWSQVTGVGPVLLQRLQQQFGSLAQAWAAPASQLRQVSGVGGQTLEAMDAQRRQRDPAALLAQYLQTNPHFLTPADPGYPRLLQEIPDPPACLHYQGNINLLDPTATLMVGIVGTREPTEYGKRWAHKLARTLAEQGITIVSGMAEGIDTYAHQGCLDAGGQTIAVLGTGVDVVYPPRNQTLHQHILERGLVLSEYPAGTRPERSHFPRRNRIVAGLCRAVLIVEAPTKSGALITAHLANDYGRDIYVLPGILDNPNALGGLGLVNRGAQLILGTHQLLVSLGAIPPLDPAAPNRVPSGVPRSGAQNARPKPEPKTKSKPKTKPENMPPSIPEALQPIWQTLGELCQQLGQDAIPLDLITEQSQRNSGEVSSALLQLELLGVVTQLPGLRYQLTDQLT
jgi:DNA processing protein